MMEVVVTTGAIGRAKLQSDRYGSVVVRTLDLQSTGRGFDSRPPYCRVATLVKSFMHAQCL